MRITESRLQQIIREEARRIIRENDEGPSGFTGEGDYASWDDVYDILKDRMEFDTGPDNRWAETGYRSEPGAPGGPTHMLHGNYSGLRHYIGPYGPFGPDYRGAKPISFDEVGRVRDWSDEREASILRDEARRFMMDFESNFPGAADQRKIDDRRLGGPGPNRTRLDPLSIPIPYFEDFKDVIVTWLANALTGEDHPIPWPEDRELT